MYIFLWKEMILMIFLMSKRVFLNVMCPLTPKSVLLNANYYIADCKSPSKVNDAEPDTYFDEEEQKWVKKSKPKTIEATQFNIKYGLGCLNQSAYVTSLLSDGVDPEHAVYERMIQRMYSLNTMQEIYEDLYLSPRKGNGVLFIIYYSDEYIINFGHLTAEFLAYNFGEDITFVDPTYRSYVKGQSIYKANKERAKFVESQLREASMFVGFKAALKRVENGDDVLTCIEGLTEHLASFTFNDCIQLYNILWPNDPLPRGNYTVEQLKDLIITRAVDNARFMGKNKDSEQNNQRLSVIDIYNPGY